MGGWLTYLTWSISFVLGEELLRICLTRIDWVAESSAEEVNTLEEEEEED